MTSQLFLNAMAVTFGYCYVLAWVAVGTSVLGSILYLVAAVKITGAMKDADEREWEREQEARGIPPVKKEDPKAKARKEKAEKERQEREKKLKVTTVSSPS
jgi:putative Ca2+/H+ antiporter (TMEM165/GDT1 family)